MIKRIVLVGMSLSIFTLSLIGHTTDKSHVDVTPGEYEVSAQIIMPHLEENLRYATTNYTQCLNREDASSLFPILSHVSFSDCELVAKTAEEQFTEFDLVCLNAEAASGSARYIINKKMFRAILEVKMGGKNMKFSQRIQGHRVGSCL